MLQNLKAWCRRHKRAIWIVHHAHTPLHCLYLGLVAVETSYFYAWAAAGLLGVTLAAAISGD